MMVRGFAQRFALMAALIVLIGADAHAQASTPAESAGTAPSAAPGAPAAAPPPPAVSPSGAPIALPALSKECPAANAQIMSSGPLPQLAKALKTRKTLRILSFGASTTTGSGRGAYTDVIEKLLETAIKGIDVEIIDRGVSGELVRQSVERLKVEVALGTPDLVLWQVGTADALAQVPIQEFTQNVVEVIRWLKDHDVDVVLVGLNYARSMRTDPHYQETRSALRKIAHQENVLRIGRYEAMELIERVGLSGPASVPREFALSESGYTCMAEYVARAITSGLFVRRENIRPPG